jgi:hypothetical protein
MNSLMTSSAHRKNVPQSLVAKMRIGPVMKLKPSIPLTITKEATLRKITLNVSFLHQSPSIRPDVVVVFLTTSHRSFSNNTLSRFGHVGWSYLGPEPDPERLRGHASPRKWEEAKC